MSSSYTAGCKKLVKDVGSNMQVFRTPAFLTSSASQPLLLQLASVAVSSAVHAVLLGDSWIEFSFSRCNSLCGTRMTLSNALPFHEAPVVRM